MITRGVIALISILLALQPAGAASFVAFSMNEAARQLGEQKSASDEVAHLGGMTHPLGMVYDRQERDCILVGIAVEGAPPVALDDLVAAMRALINHGKAPLVSIEKTAETDSTGMQAVLFEGGIENTSLGNAMLEVDLHLKRLALGTLSAEVWGVPSYVKLLAAETRGGTVKTRIISRFWVSNPRPSLATRKEDGVFVIMQLNPMIETEILYAESEGKPVRDLGALRDAVGDVFAGRLTQAMDDLAVSYPVFARVKPILAIVSLALGMRDVLEGADLEFWLKDYAVPVVETPKQVALVRAREVMQDIKQEWVLNGGIRSNPTAIRLRKGYPSAFKEAVLAARPNPQTLVWHPSLENWPLPSDYELELQADGQDTPSARNPAFSVEALLLPTGAGGLPASSPLPDTALRPLRTAMAPLALTERATAAELSFNIGGVMLSGAARVEGAERAEVSLTGGNFALVVDGKDARIDPKLFRKFVTALWCVYYSRQAPGISIDPIGPMGPDTEKHLVRYIGRVINTDLGRVMREADYVMKKWAVGTERPVYPGFRPVDGWMARFGTDQSGVSRRFWFVPEELQFKQGGDLLLFAGGRMRLNTEYNVDGMRGRANKADEQFAQFFTQHYSKLAEKYPIYAELFEYAKLVALAQYLKEEGVPLHWFLLAHKDLVLTEDSPGTVDQIAKGSDYFRGMTLMGGVDLEPHSQYVYDQEAVDAIRKVIDEQRAGKGSSPVVARGAQQAMLVRPAVIEAGRQSYTLLPQHSLTSGKDHRGIRYQTDLALRTSGQPGLELVRYFNPRQRESGHFGRGWHLLIPYRVEPADRQTRTFLNAVIPQRMAVVNVLSGTREVFTFSADRYAAAGYVPEHVGASQVVGLFLMSDASFRLADKLGNQFHFDAAGRMTAMLLSPSPEHQMHIEYLDRFTGAFIEPPYVARPAGEQWTDFLNARIPRQVEVRDRVSDHVEVLTFRAAHDIAGYVPSDAKTSRFRIAALLTNGGLEILDVHGNRIRLNGAWDFDSILPAPERQMVRSVSMGGRRITFGYTVDAQGQVVMATAAVSEDKPHADSTWVVRYEYDDGGRLCRVHPPAGSPRPMLSAMCR